MTNIASALNNHAKATLPSIEGWGTNMNILRDPPKSIHTRRIDKVGDNSAITIMNGESPDRICEAITVYARGVNPMVGVSYQTYGNNGGNAKLPYRIMKDGEFRPPISGIDQTSSLSRLPRITTNINGKIKVTDYTKRLKNCGNKKNTKEVREAILKASASPTAVYRINKIQQPTYDVNNNIKETMKLNVTSGIKPMDIKQKINNKNITQVLKDKLEVFANSNKGMSKRTGNINSVNTDNYIQDSLTHNASTNPNSYKYEIPTNINTDNYIQDVIAINQTAPVSSSKYNEYISTDITLEKLLPQYQIYSNKNNRKINKKMEHENDIKTTRNIPITEAITNARINGNTNYITTTPKLKETISAGGTGGINKSAIPMLNINPDIKLGEKNIAKNVNSVGGVSIISKKGN
jgi:hypothetical protein